MEEMKILLSGRQVIPSLMFGSVYLPTLAVLSLSKNWGKPSYLPFICSEMTQEGCQKHQEDEKFNTAHRKRCALKSELLNINRPVV